MAIEESPFQPLKPAARDMLVHLAHELRQPLSTIESMAFYLQMTAGEAEDGIAAQAERMRQMVDNANWILTDILHLLQDSPARAARLDLRELAADLMTESWLSDGSLISPNPASVPVIVFADGDQVRHLVAGVVHYLRKVSQGGAISVSVSQDSRRGVLALGAHAPGVNAGTVFAPQQSQQLLTCKQFAESNGGSLTVEKDDHGHLTLKVALPLPASTAALPDAIRSNDLPAASPTP